MVRTSRTDRSIDRMDAAVPDMLGLWGIYKLPWLAKASERCGTSLEPAWADTLDVERVLEQGFAKPEMEAESDQPN